MSTIDEKMQAIYLAEIMEILNNLPQGIIGGILFQTRMMEAIEKIWNDGYGAAMSAVINEKHTKE